MTLPIFVSYASDNRRFESDRLLFDEFVAELENEVGLHVQSDAGRLMFVANRDIQAGTEWTAELADALRQASVMLCFGSMHYFNSRWCGREFEVFRRRRQDWIQAHPGQPAPMAIIPVPWIPVDDMPPVAQAFQDNDAAFPVEYRQLGLRKLLELDRKAERVQVRTALGERLKKRRPKQIRHCCETKSVTPLLMTTAGRQKPSNGAGFRGVRSKVVTLHPTLSQRSKFVTAFLMC